MNTKNLRWIPLLFSLLYFACAVFLPVHATWFAGLIRTFLVAIAACCSLLLWVSYTVWVRRGWHSTAGLLTIAALLPVVIYGIPAGIGSYRARKLMELDTRVKKEATLITMADTELTTEHGNPIGVRLRYQVRYPRGADALIAHVPPANLSNALDPYAGGFWVRSTEIHALTATDYEMTSDIVPEFMPPTVRFVANPKYPASGGSVPCFNWTGGPSQRVAVLATPPRTFRIFLLEPTYSAPTARSYDLRRFYDGAVGEGAKECPER